MKSYIYLNEYILKFQEKLALYGITLSFLSTIFVMVHSPRNISSIIYQNYNF